MRLLPGVKLLPACSTGVIGHPTADRIDPVLAMCQQLRPYVNSFELMWPGDSYRALGEEEFVKKIKKARLRFCAVHASRKVGILLGSLKQEEQRDGLNRLRQICRVTKAIGARLVVLHLWEPKHDEHFETHNLAQLPAALRIAQEQGVLLAVEAVPCDRGKERNPLKRILAVISLAERTGLQKHLGVTLDTEFLASVYPDVFQAVFAKEYRPIFRYLRHIHVKDFSGQAFIGGERVYSHPGEGNLNLPGWFARLRGVYRFTYKNLAVSLETPAPGPDIPRLARSLGYVSRLCAK